MYDLHCHLLPGIDDGPKTVDQSIALAKTAVEQGITHILCTPHYNSAYQNTKAEIMQAVKEFEVVLEKNELPLEIQAGQEVHIKHDLIEDIQKDKIIFWGSKKQFLLIEFPAFSVPLFSERIFDTLAGLNKIPIIVHPERNDYFMKDPNRLIPFIQLGALVQVTAGSITGDFGKNSQKCAVKMLKRNLAHILSSDAHNLKKRKFQMAKAYRELEKSLSMERVAEMKNLNKMIYQMDNDKEIKVYPPKKIKKFGIL
jgi:protein-tyrosine phosphatase